MSMSGGGAPPSASIKWEASAPIEWEGGHGPAHFSVVEGEARQQGPRNNRRTIVIDTIR